MPDQKSTSKQHESRKKRGPGDPKKDRRMAGPARKPCEIHPVRIPSAKKSQQPHQAGDDQLLDSRSQALRACLGGDPHL